MAAPVAGARRRWLALGLGACVAAVAWLCLTPFRVGPPGLERVEWIPFTHVCPIHGPHCVRDALRNVALFVPLGVLAAARWPGAALRAAAALGAALSIAIEVAQVFLPARAPSTADVLANVTGALAGAAAVARLARARRPEGGAAPPARAIR